MTASVRIGTNRHDPLSLRFRPSATPVPCIGTVSTTPRQVRPPQAVPPGFAGITFPP